MPLKLILSNSCCYQWWGQLYPGSDGGDVNIRSSDDGNRYMHPVSCWLIKQTCSEISNCDMCIVKLKMKLIMYVINLQQCRLIHVHVTYFCRGLYTTYCAVLLQNIHYCCTTYTTVVQRTLLLYNVHYYCTTYTTVVQHTLLSCAGSFRVCALTSVCYFRSARVDTNEDCDPQLAPE